MPGTTFTANQLLVKPVESGNPDVGNDLVRSVGRGRIAVLRGEWLFHQVIGNVLQLQFAGGTNRLNAADDCNADQHTDQTILDRGGTFVATQKFQQQHDFPQKLVVRLLQM